MNASHVLRTLKVMESAVAVAVVMGESYVLLAVVVEVVVDLAAALAVAVDAVDRLHHK